MRAMVIHESMFGNTRAIAEAIGAGLSSTYDVEVRPAGTVTVQELEGVDLLVVGGPTHAWGISRPSTRAGALQQVEVPGSGLRLESGATGPGLRELFADVRGLRIDAAVFDTRIDKPAALTGRASRKLARLLRSCGCHLVARPQSFLVSGRPVTLVPGEEERARGWGSQLAALGPVTGGRGH